MSSLKTDIEEDVRQQLGRTARFVDSALRGRLEKSRAEDTSLLAAMRYSLESGGKRLRPALVLWSCEACGGNDAEALPAALAVECVHTFSLIHDDLPALDNDDMRRGRPANHKEFGEASAILAGDALFALAFEIIAADVSDPRMAVAMIHELAAASGFRGMIGGEAADLKGAALPPDADRVARIHAAKTARLIEACCRLGAMAADAPRHAQDVLGRFGHELGLAFQAADDLLDVTGTTENLGKPVRRDDVSGKQTYPRAVGMEAARRIARQARDRAVAALEPFGDRAARLAVLARYVVERNS